MWSHSVTQMVKNSVHSPSCQQSSCLSLLSIWITDIEAPHLASTLSLLCEGTGIFRLEKSAAQANCYPPVSMWDRKLHSISWPCNRGYALNIWHRSVDWKDGVYRNFSPSRLQVLRIYFFLAWMQILYFFSHEHNTCHSRLLLLMIDTKKPLDTCSWHKQRRFRAIWFILWRVNVSDQT